MPKFPQAVLPVLAVACGSQISYQSSQVSMGLNLLRSMCFEPVFFKYQKAKRTAASPWLLKALNVSVLQASSLQYEMLLLTDSISKEDSCWELRLRCGEFKRLVWKLYFKMLCPGPCTIARFLRKGTDTDSGDLWLGLKMELAPDGFVLG